MQVTSKIKMDLTKPELSPYVNAVQGDSYSRSLEIALYTGVHPWSIPDDASVAVRYAKPDRTGGYYDTLPDGTTAWHISGNTLTIQLAPQMLTVAGNVKVQIELIQGTSILSTFCLTVRVEANAAAGVLKSGNYINWLQWIRDQSAEQVDQIEQSVQSTYQNSQIATLAADHATKASDTATLAASQATDFVADIVTIRDDVQAIAADVSAIVAGNEAYTKSESDFRFCPVITPTVRGMYLSLRDSLNQPIRVLNLFGKTTQHSIPSPVAPVELVNAGSKGSILVSVAGKNLCPGYKPGAYLARTGLYQVVSSYQCTEMIPVVPGALYTYSNGINANISDVHYYSENKEWLGKYTGNDSNYINIRPEGTAYIGINHYQCDNLMWVQLELGSTATSYEAYIEPQTLAVSTVNGLAGIPVSSEGNYTDEEGQQWICDEINLSAGVIIQRVGRLDSYNDESVGPVFLSSSGTLSSGASVLYPLTQPIQTSLSEEELTTFKSLYLNHPNTVVMNSDSICMEVSYVADIMLYIDNKLAPSSSGM